MKMRNKLMTGLAMAVMIPMLSMLVTNTNLLRNAIEQSFQGKITSDLRRVVERDIPGMMATARNYVVFVALDSTFGKAAYYALAVGSVDDLVKQLAAFRDRLNLSFMETVDPNGKIVQSTQDGRTGKQVELKEVVAAIDKDEFYQNFAFDKETQRFAITIAAPIIQRNDRIGFLFGGYSFDVPLLEKLANGDSIALVGPGGEQAKDGWDSGIPGPELVTQLIQGVQQCAGNLPECKNLRVQFRASEKDGVPYVVASTPLITPTAQPLGVLIIGKDASQTTQAVDKARMLIGSLAALFMVLALIAGWIFAGTIARTIAMVSRIIERMAGGDLTQRAVIPAKPDEIHSMAALVNQMADSMTKTARSMYLQSGDTAAVAKEFDKFNKILQKEAETIRAMSVEAVEANNVIDNDTMRLRDNVDQAVLNIEKICNRIENLSDNIHTIAAASEEASQNVTTMAAASEQMSANVQEVNTSLNKVSRSVEEVTHAVEVMSTSLDDVRRRCQSAAEESSLANQKAEKTRQLMNSLAKAADEIGKVVDVINSVAEQTNMLALNAAIEAAGAGDAGRGFAVVANEVKELARQTNDSTSMIFDQIQQIQQQSRVASTSVGEISEGIKRIDRANQEISTSVEEQSAMVLGITESMHQVESAANDVTHNAAELDNAVREVARASAEAASGTSEIAHSASVLSSEAQILKQESNAAKEQARAVQGLGTDILSASAEVQKRGLQSMQAVTNIVGWISQAGLLTSLVNETSGALQGVASELTIGQPPFSVEDVKHYHLGLFSNLTNVVRSGRYQEAEQIFHEERCQCDVMAGKRKMSPEQERKIEQIRLVHRQFHQRVQEAARQIKGGDPDENALMIMRLGEKELRTFFAVLDSSFLDADGWKNG